MAWVWVLIPRSGENNWGTSRLLLNGTVQLDLVPQGTIP